MKEKIILNVTASDIGAGERANCFHCPIAKAMVRQFPGCDFASARGTVLFFCRGEQGYRATPPSEAKQFMDDFDSGRTVMPFSFIATFKTGEIDRDGKK